MGLARPNPRRSHLRPRVSLSINGQERAIIEDAALMRRQTNRSPWWYVRHGDKAAAKKSLLRLTSRNQPDFDADETIAMIEYTNELEKEMSAGVSFRDCFRGVDLRRTEIVVGIWLVQTRTSHRIKDVFPVLTLVFVVETWVQAHIKSFWRDGVVFALSKAGDPAPQVCVYGLNVIQHSPLLVVAPFNHVDQMAMSALASSVEIRVRQVVLKEVVADCCHRSV